MTSTTTATFTRALDTLDQAAADVTISEATYARLIAYVATSDVHAARLAYTIRLRGVAGSEGAASLKRMAADLDRTPGALSQWATAYGYLVTGTVPVTPETFRDARRAYNSTKDGRAHVVATLPTIAAADEDARAGMLHTLAETVAEWKKKPAGTVATTDATTDAETSDAETRAARPADGVDVGTYTIAWVNRLAELARDAGTGDESRIALSSSQAAEVTNLLATIATFVMIGEEVTIAA